MEEQVTNLTVVHTLTHWPSCLFVADFKWFVWHDINGCRFIHSENAPLYFTFFPVEIPVL